MAKTTVVFDKNGEAVTIDGVRSEYVPFFRLVHGAAVEEIAEPIGWGEADMVLDRDPDYHGFHYEYISAATPLTFTCDHARGMITEVYESEGGDGLIYLEYGLSDGSAIIVTEYEGRLDLNSYDYAEDGITCNVERKSLHEVVSSRWDTIVNLYNNKSLDDATITTATAKQLTLHSMAIRERYKKEFPTRVGQTDTKGPIQVQPADGFYYIFPDTDSPTVNEVKTATPQMLSVQALSLQGSLAYANKTPFSCFTFDSDGDYTVSVSWTIQIWAIISRKFGYGNLLIGDINISGYIEIVGAIDSDNNGKPDRVDRYLMNGQQLNVGIDARETGLLTVNTYLNQEITVYKGDKLIIYLELDLVPFENTDKLRFVEFSTLKTTEFKLNLEGATKADLSASKGLTYGECVLQALRVVTGLNDPLRAPMLGIQDASTRVSGEASNYLVASGFMIRKFDEVNRPLKTSLSELITSGDALFCIGMQYDEKSSGQYVKIMPAKDFYAGAEIIYITSCSDYKESADKEIVYNQVEIGYEKYIDDPLAIGNLDEYNTRHEYQTPIKTEKNKWSKLSRLVGSGYAIEQTRREQFTDKPNDSTQFDDSNFIIAYVSGSGSSLTTTMNFNGLGSNNYIGLGNDTLVPSWVVQGMALQVSGTFANNRVYTVTRIDAINRRIWVLENVNTSLFFNSATIAAYNYIGKAEKAEPFDSVTNLFGSETAYNLRRTPKRMLITHAPFIASGLKYKPQIDKIKSTFVKNNGLLTTQLKNTEPYPLGDIDFAEWTENQDVALEDLQSGARMFSPEKITFSCRLTKEELNLIRRALLGKTSTNKDYGYVSVKNPEGVKVSGYPVQIIYKQNSEECKLVLRKK